MEVLYKVPEAMENRNCIPGNLKGSVRRRRIICTDLHSSTGCSHGKLAAMSYQEVAYEVMSRFLTDFTEDELKTVLQRIRCEI